MAMSTPDNDYEWKKNLPQGVKFKPTNEELNLYLRIKSSNGEILPGIINELDIYKYEPEELSGFAIKHTEGRMYFFTPLTIKYDVGKKIQRKIYSDKGFWKASVARSNLTNKNGTIIGTKTNLAYYENKDHKKSEGKKTSWLMQEFRLPENHHPRPVFNGTKKELIICVIYYNGTIKDDDQEVAVLTQYDHHIPPQTPNPNLPFNQNFDQSPYTLPIHSNPYISHYDNISNCVPLQQYQPHVNTDPFAIVGEGWPVEQASPDLPPLPYSDLDGFDPSVYLNFDNINVYVEDEIGSDIPNGIADFPPWPSSSYSTMLCTGSCSYNSGTDQNKVETNVTPISQGNQNPSNGSQDPQQKMKKIKI